MSSLLSGLAMPGNPQEEIMMLSLEEYRARCKKFAREIELLQIELKRTTEENAEVVNHLNTEVKTKEQEKRQLQATLQDTVVNEELNRKKLVAMYELQLSKFQQEADERMTKLITELQKYKNDLAELWKFREEKESMEKNLREKDALIERLKREHLEELQERERTHVANFAEQAEEAKKKIETIKKSSREEAVKQLDEESRQIRAEIGQLREQLQMHIQFNESLRKENEKFRGSMKKFKIESELNAQRDHEYALRGVKQQKENKELQQRVKTLERSLSQVLTEMEGERKNWASQHGKEVEDLRLECTGLKQLVKMKTKELKQIKKLSQIILDQRTEVEQFLLEALEQVKEELRKKKEEEYKAAKAEYNRQLREASQTQSKLRTKFPSIGRINADGTVDGALLPGATLPAASPKPPNARLDLRDLSLEDRERVLRLLFARMNTSSQGAAAAAARAISPNDRPSGHEETILPPDMGDDGGGMPDSSPFLTQQYDGEDMGMGPSSGRFSAGGGSLSNRSRGGSAGMGMAEAMASDRDERKRRSPDEFFRGASSGMRPALS